MRALCTLLLLFLLFGSLAAQERPLQRSEHGWYLSPHGTIRVLVIFAEIDWDLDPARDPQPRAAGHWAKGRLPTWKDDLFDPHPLRTPRAEITRYYHDISLGQYTVLGDYVDKLVILRQSEYPGLVNAHGINRFVVEEANKQGSLRTSKGLSVADFDMWKRGGKPGMPKEAGADDPHSYDHVMVILRNSTLTHGQGSVDSGSPGKLFGYESDSQSRFGGMNALPFEILKHEFNHLLLGGNNFHSGGGNAAQFQSHFICVQGGWSMMGGANSSLLTCSAWDRDRLGWKPEGSRHRIRARDVRGREVNADLDPIAGDTGRFVLRDFVTSGDALRIRMPFLPEDVHQQWLWVENHQGHQRNGSPTDRFHWEFDNSCIAAMEPGLFMVMQVDRELREGTNIFSGYADYLRPLPANGNYDISLRGDTVRGSCPFGGESMIYTLEDRMANPLTGNHEQELVVYDRDGNGSLSRAEHFVPGARSTRGHVQDNAIFFGRPEHAFRVNGKRRLAMGTNPSSANMLTFVAGGGRAKYADGAPNARTVYLNGISVELMEQLPDGAMVVHVRANDTCIDEDVRWCGDSIVLPPLRGHEGHALFLTSRARLTLDRSGTPTRMTDPEKEGSRVYFNSPTRFTVDAEASVMLDARSTLELKNGSELHLLPGSRLALRKGARLRVDRSSRIVLHEGAQLRAPEKDLRKLRSRGALVDQYARTLRPSR